MRKKISDTVYVLFQPCLVYFAFGDGRGRIPPQARLPLLFSSTTLSVKIATPVS